ncbi:TIGR02597 family protein [Luteolibacter ambystomatis]|uniref:TIGR02597 family protein n=1 Tax=Luteolibacter ambystomatis TaxID=2824561 RepID=A0A975G8E3_9BACT|nr:TIGR02597 family protein [Luteolibacter ambystomatis]QUE50615.1 TIGR02597 family protein [Luteolibacter ambystomatis]
MKHLFASAALGLLLPAAAHAASVTFSAVPTARTVVAADGVTVLSGGTVWVGTLSSTSFTYNPLTSVSDNVNNIIAQGGWERFGYDTVTGDPNPGASSNLAIRTSPQGRIGGTATDNNSGTTAADYFNNATIYLWVFNGATPETSTEFGIFTATSAGTPWLFPVNAGGVGDTVTLSTTTSAAPVITAVGGVGSTPAGQLRLVSAVPEPSAPLLLGLAAVGLTFMRRRGRALAAVAALAGPLHATELSNNPVGYLTVTLPGGSQQSPRLSLISPTLVRPLSWQGTITAVSANTSGPTTFSVAGNPWTDGQFNGVNGSYYAEVVPRTGSGVVSDITGTTEGVAPDGSSLTTFDNLAAFASVGDELRVRKHVTLGGFFGETNAAGLLASDDPSTADEVLVYDGGTFTSYFYYTGDEVFAAGWYDTNFTLAPGEAAKVVIAPNQGLVVKRRGTAPLSFRYTGAAKTGDTLLPVVNGSNVLGTVSSASLTLGTSGLHTGDASTGVNGGEDPSVADEIVLYTASGPVSYFYYTGAPDFPAGWYDSAFTLAPGEADNIRIEPGSSFVLKRKSGAPFNWTQPAPKVF